MQMKRSILVILALCVNGLPGFASSLGTAARTVIPVEIQQIINVDYRRMKGSDTAMVMKAKLLPPEMKQFELALKGIGVIPERDLEQITLASFRTKEHGVDMVGIAQGEFPRKVLALRITKQKIKGEKQKQTGAVLYSMAGGMTMTFLDDWTMLFGSKTAVQSSLDARDNSSQSLNANADALDMIAAVEQGTVWSILDKSGTQNMMKSALGSASDLAEYETLKKKLVGSRYTLDFDHGVDFNMSVVTTDSITASTLSTIMKAGIMFKKLNATGAEKLAMEETKVDSDNSKLLVHFKADDKNFQSLIDSPMFASVTH